MYARVSGAVDWIEEQFCSLSKNPPSSCESSAVEGAMARPLVEPGEPLATTGCGLLIQKDRAGEANAATADTGSNDGRGSVGLDQDDTPHDDWIQPDSALVSTGVSTNDGMPQQETKNNGGGDLGPSGWWL